MVLVFLGLGYLYFSPRESPLPTVIHAVVRSPGDRTRNSRGQFVSSSSSSGSASSASSENGDQEQQGDQPESLGSPTADLSGTFPHNKNHHLGYSILISSLSDKFLSLVRNVPFGDLETAFHTISSYFVVRTNAERFALADELATATMRPDEDFLSFCARLESLRTSIIEAGGDTGDCSDGRMVNSLLQGVARHHEDTFRHILQVLRSDLT